MNKKDIPRGIHFFDNITRQLQLKFYVSLRIDLLKCFSVDVPHSRGDLIESFRFTLNTSIFPDGRRPTHPNFDNNGQGFYMSFHYPKQLFLFSNHWVYKWKDMSSSINGYNVLYEIDSMTVVSKRNTPKSHCIKDWKNADQVVMDSIIKGMRCRPPFWKTDLNIDTCSNSTLKKFSVNSLFDNVWSIRNPPCKFIEQLLFRKEEYGNDGTSGKLQCQN